MSSLPFLFCVYKLTAAKLVWTEWICNSKLHRANLQYNITNSLILSEESFTFKYFFGTQLINIVKIWKIVPERRGGHVCFLLDALLILALFEKTLQTIALFLDPFLISAAHLPLPLSKLKSVKVEWSGGHNLPSLPPPLLCNYTLPFWQLGIIAKARNKRECPSLPIHTPTFYSRKRFTVYTV